MLTPSRFFFQTGVFGRSGYILFVLSLLPYRSRKEKKTEWESVGARRTLALGAGPSAAQERCPGPSGGRLLLSSAQSMYPAQTAWRAFLCGTARCSGSTRKDPPNVLRFLCPGTKFTHLLDRYHFSDLFAALPPPVVLEVPETSPHFTLAASSARSAPPVPGDGQTPPGGLRPAV